MLLTPMFRISSAKDKRHVVPERLPKNLLFGHQNAQDISRYVIKDRKTPNLTLKTEFFFCSGFISGDISAFTCEIHKKVLQEEAINPILARFSWELNVRKADIFRHVFPISCWGWGLIGLCDHCESQMSHFGKQALTFLAAKVLRGCATNLALLYQHCYITMHVRAASASELCTIMPHRNAFWVQRCLTIIFCYYEKRSGT